MNMTDRPTDEYTLLSRCDTLFFSYKTMLSRSEPRDEIEIATNRITTMFLYFGKSEPQRSYKHGSYKKKRV